MTTNDVPATPDHEVPIDPMTGYPDYTTPAEAAEALAPPSGGQHRKPEAAATDGQTEAAPQTGAADESPATPAPAVHTEAVAGTAPSPLSEAAFTYFAQGMHDQFSQVHAAMRANFSALERNYEESLSHLRTRAEEAENTVMNDLLKPLAQRFAMMIDRLELSIHRAEDDPWLLATTIVDETVDILDEFGIETIPCEPGSEVVRSQHRVVKMLNERTSPDDTQEITERRRHGMVVDGYVVRPAEVIAQWVPPAGERSEPAEE